MATEKRERQRTNRAQKLEEEAKTERKEEIRQRGFTGAMIAAAVLAGLGLLWFATRSDDEVETDTTGAAAESTESADEATGDETGSDEAAADTTTTTVAASAVVPPEPGATIDGETECPEADGSSERVTQFSAEPPMCIDAAGSYTAVLATTKGDITIELDAAKAPNTVNNFVVLSRYHYYEDTPFHRIIPDFVIQGGDAVGPRLGVGNPGYLIDEEPPAEGEYQVGSLAMAKGQGPTSTGSQFFIITGANGAALPPEYSLFGQVTEGMDVVAAIEAIPTTTDDSPTEEIYVESVTITES